jgi:hypothetical protein
VRSANTFKTYRNFEFKTHKSLLRAGGGAEYSEKYHESEYRLERQLIDCIRQMIRRQMGVYHGCLNIGMARELLHSRHIYSLHHKMAGECIPESVYFGQTVNSGLPDACYDLSSFCNLLYDRDHID